MKLGDIIPDGGILDREGRPAENDDQTGDEPEAHRDLLRGRSETPSWLQTSDRGRARKLGASVGTVNEKRSGSDAAYFGGNSPTDSSGTLDYVQIRFSGFILSANVELQALTLEGTGSGTVIRHIHSHNSSDDGVDADNKAELWIEDSEIRDHDDDGVEMMRAELLQCAAVVTPNIPEAEILSGRRIESIEQARAAEVSEQAESRILGLGAA